MRYRQFVEDYRQRRLDEAAEASKNGQRPDGASGTGDEAPPVETSRAPRASWRKYLREYVRWLWPCCYAVGGVFFFALMVAGLQMIEPLFVR